MSYYEPAWDEDGNPEVGYWVKEEPDCPPCGDSGFVGRRNCRYCNPSQLQHLWWRLTWRIRWHARSIGDLLRGRRYDDEAPF